MFAKLSSNYYEPIFLLLIFVISFLFFYPNGFILENFYKPGDETTYKNLAIKLVDQKIYAEDFDNLRSWRPPGYAFYLSIFYFLFGENGFKIVPFINYFFYLISYFLIFKVCKFFFNYKESFIISFTVFIFHAYKFNQVLVINYSETLFFFLTSFFLFFFLKSFLNKKKSLFILSFIILSLSYMVRGPTLPLGIIIFIFLFLFQKNFSKKFVLFCLIVFLTPAIIWIIRNFYVLGFGPHLYTANYMLIYYGLFDYLEAHKIDDMIRGLDDLGKVNKLKPLIIQKIQNDPFGSLFHYLKKIIKHFYYHNTYFFTVTLVIFSIFGYFKNKKKLLELLIDENSILFVFGVLISIGFIMVSSMAQFSWRYSLIPSIYKLLFEFLLIMYFINFKSNVFFQNFKFK